MKRRLGRAFFARSALEVAPDLLGQRLVRIAGETRLSGTIVETEAYVGTEDLGCHARAGRTARNRTMWGPPGHAYVYFTYGMHWLLNAVTETDGHPGAVLIRAIAPEEGVEEMRRRRTRPGRPAPPDRILADGPAKLCQALGIAGALDGADLCAPGAELFVEEGEPVPDAQVVTGPRVGLYSVPEPWKSLPWRFRRAPGPSSTSSSFAKRARLSERG